MQGPIIFSSGNINNVTVAEGFYSPSCLSNFTAKLYYDKHYASSYEAIKDKRFMVRYISDVKLARNETNVTLFGTNVLRTFVPNFAYMLGYVESQDNVYLLYELFEATTLREFNLSYYLQVLLALYVGEKYIGFTHYNLTPDNVYLRKFEHKFAIEYPFRNTYVRVVTDTVVVIANSCYSRIEVDGKVYGCSGYKTFNVDPNRKDVLYDAKVLLNCLPTNEDKSRVQDIINQNSSIDDVIDHIIRLRKDNVSCTTMLTGPVYHFSLPDVLSLTLFHDLMLDVRRRKQTNSVLYRYLRSREPDVGKEISDLRKELERPVYNVKPPDLRRYHVLFSVNVHNLFAKAVLEFISKYNDIQTYVYRLNVIKDIATYTYRQTILTIESLLSDHVKAMNEVIKAYISNYRYIRSLPQEMIERYPFYKVDYWFLQPIF
jgi:hypothetical protein